MLINMDFRPTYHRSIQEAINGLEEIIHNLDRCDDFSKLSFESLYRECYRNCYALESKTCVDKDVWLTIFNNIKSKTLHFSHFKFQSLCSCFLYFRRKCCSGEMDLWFENRLEQLKRKESFLTEMYCF